MNDKKRHYMSFSPTYKSWSAMKNRCKHKSVPSFKYYGGRGISYDPRWDNFRNFLEDMGDRPNGTQLDRIDSDGNYCKENCKWSTVNENNFNQKTNKKFRGTHKTKNGKYQAIIKIDRKSYYIGTFLTEDEAHREYCKVAKEWYGRDVPEIKKQIEELENNVDKHKL